MKTARLEKTNDPEKRQTRSPLKVKKATEEHKEKQNLFENKNQLLQASPM
tara:strand:- start:859 stop:1008 length:150 start_codon:yes stop_codon:yes gene_type:complete